MKKRLTALLLAIITLSFCMVLPASAERQTMLPTLIASPSGSKVLRSFTVTDVRKVPDKYENRIHFAIDADSGSYDIRCYDASGFYLNTVSIYVSTASDYSDTFVDVPDLTAAIEFVPTYGAVTNSYYYCNYVNVYAADGRIMGVCDLLVPVYETVGWHRAVKMYALDGRELLISPFQISAYEQVGWYTATNYYYYLVQQLYAAYKANREYANMLVLVDDSLKVLAGTPHEASLYAIRLEAMNAWRAAAYTPIAVSNTFIEAGSPPEASIQFFNVSFKKVIAFKLNFTCYNVFGEVEKSYYDYYYCDNADLAPSAHDTYTWDLYGVDSLHHIGNIRITEVVFEDGTKWVG